MSNGHYDTMQVCMNGHEINSAARSAPEHSADYCPSCGEKTITECPDCGTAIRGFYHHRIPSIVGSSDPPPNFCMGCGKPFPWTRKKMEALVEIAAEEESLSDADRESLRRDAPLIATDNPKSEVAALRIKKIISKVRKHVAPLMWKIVTDLATEGAKKSMGL